MGVRRGRWPGLVPTSPERMLERDSVVNQLAGASWSDGWELRNVGPTVMGGRVVDLAVRPGTGAEFYVAYASGGLWHTRNHGTSFTPCFDRESAMTIGAVAVDWTEVLRPGVGGSLGAGMPRRIWVGTGEVNSSRSSYAGTGIFVSDDGAQLAPRGAGGGASRGAHRTPSHPAGCGVGRGVGAPVHAQWRRRRGIPNPRRRGHLDAAAGGSHADHGGRGFGGGPH